MLNSEEQSSTESYDKIKADIFQPFLFLFFLILQPSQRNLFNMRSHCRLLSQKCSFKHPRTFALELRFSQDEGLTMISVLRSYPTKKNFLLWGTLKYQFNSLEPPKAMGQCLQKLCLKVSNVLRLWKLLNTSHSVYNTDSDFVSQGRN